MAIDPRQVSFNPIQFNPTKGLASAANTFKGINTTFANNREADSLAASRQQAAEMADRQQSYVEGAGDRKIAEEQRLLQQSVDKGIFASNLAKSAGGSHMREAFEEVQKLPEYQKLGLEERTDYVHQVYNKNKRLFSDPKKYGDEIETGLLKSGKFSRKEARAIRAEKVSELFSTQDKDIALKLMRTRKGSSSGSNGSGGYGNGTNKLLSGSPSAMDEQQLLENYVGNNDLPASAAFEMFGLRPFDFNIKSLGGRRDPTKQDVVKYISRMKGEGMPAYAALGALQQISDTDGSTKIDIENLSPGDIADLRELGQGVINTQERMYNSKGGGSQAQLLLQQQQQAEDNRWNQRILSTLNPDQSTREKRLQMLRSGFPTTEPTQERPKFVSRRGEIPTAEDLTVGPQQSPGGIMPTPTDTEQNGIPPELIARPLETIPDIQVTKTPWEKGVNEATRIGGIMGNQVLSAADTFNNIAKDTAMLPVNTFKLLGDTGKWGGKKLAEMDRAQKEKLLKRKDLRQSKTQEVIQTIATGDLTNLESDWVRVAIEETKSPTDKAKLERIYNIVKESEQKSPKKGYPWPKGSQVKLFGE